MRTRLLICAAVLALPAIPAAAQSGVEGRVSRLESEMRAVQRRVFPGGAGAGALVEPQIAPQGDAGEVQGAPAGGALTDLSARVTSLEQQLSSMTGQIEQNGYRLRQLEEQFAAYRRATDAKLAERAAPAPAPAEDTAEPAPVRPATRPASVPPRETAAAPAAGGVERPATGDAAEDAYLYGYRLWAAKRYPEAQAQLKKTVADFPKHRRASYAQNLLGRAYLDEGKPSLASIAFYDNYKKMPDGERAPDSLYFLGQALLKLNKPADACKVYGELTDVYGDKIAPGMRDDVARARTSANCK